MLTLFIKQLKKATIKKLIEKAYCMNSSNGITPETKTKIINICKAIIPDAAIWLYGSRARADFSENSDIDLALEADRPISFFEISELKDTLRATNLSYSFDIVDINSIKDNNFENMIKKERILWKK
jgi:predicted nucleotidyltransferase